MQKINKLINYKIMDIICFYKSEYILWAEDNNLLNIGYKNYKCLF